MMKRTILSIALVAVMALTVVSTAGVLAAPKAAAQEPVTPIVITYQAGKTYTFTPKQYNLREASFEPYVGTPVHKEFANRGTSFAMIQDKAQAGAGGTRVGVLLQLDGGLDTWTTVWNKPCKVTMTVPYTIVAKGDANTHAVVSALIVNPHGITDGRDVVTYGTDKTAVKTGTITLEHTGIVDDVLHYVMAEPSLVEGSVYTISSVGQDNPVATTGHASANAYTPSITISFL